MALHHALLLLPLWQKASVLALGQRKAQVEPATTFINVSVLPEALQYN